jgi:CRISPR system Cascade subunit CasC
MMGFTSFDSACFYRYARIDWGQLVKNLNGDADLARLTVEAFLRASVAAVPSGKQNSFAANNPPNFLLAVVRQDGMGWSLANAFENPVRPHSDGGLVTPSVAALDAYWGRLCQVYGTDTLTRTAALPLDADLPLESLKEAQVENLEAWIRAVTEMLPAGEGAP